MLLWHKYLLDRPLVQSTLCRSACRYSLANVWTKNGNIFKLFIWPKHFALLPNVRLFRLTMSRIWATKKWKWKRQKFRRSSERFQTKSWCGFHLRWWKELRPQKWGAFSCRAFFRSTRMASLRPLGSRRWRKMEPNWWPRLKCTKTGVGLVYKF